MENNEINEKINNDTLSAFRNHISKLVPISQQIWDELKSIINIRKIAKEDFIVKENQKYNQEIFVYQGIVRGFYCSDKANEFNVVFYQGNDLACPCSNRTKNGRSNINLQALAPTSIFEIDQDAMKILRLKYKELYEYGIMIQEYELNRKTDREISILVKNAEERYLQFQKLYPQLENKISQFHIASYVGITPVSLSRLRKKLAKR
jgi:CRP-like cAMP-binding protein